MSGPASHLDAAVQLRGVRGLILGVALLAAGCGDDAAAPASSRGSSSVTGGGGGAGGCAPGEHADDAGNCVHAGVPAERCGEGFEADGTDGCVAILPADSCAPGTLAIPGETRCREVAPCDPGEYGSIPIEPSTVYVNADYAGATSDGTETQPFTTVQEGVDAAASGAIVAIAAGNYPEDVLVTRPVRLWGRCPAMVEIQGANVNDAAIVLATVDGAVEIRDLALTGSAQRALTVLGSAPVLADRLWIHDAHRGISIPSDYGPTTMTLSRSLIERVQRVAIVVAGADLTVHESAIRETLPQVEDDRYGRGIVVQATSTDPPVVEGKTRLALDRCLVERSRWVGIDVQGVEAEIAGTVIRDTQPQLSDQGLGIGIRAQKDPTTGLRASVIVTSSVIERSHTSGINLDAADAQIEDSVVRDTDVQASDQRYGRGIAAQALDVDPSMPTLRRSVIERSKGAGLFLVGGDAVVEASVIRDTAPEPSGMFGFGVNVQGILLMKGGGEAKSVPTSATVSASVVERNRVAGIGVFGADATIEGTVVRDTGASDDGTYGDGIMLYDNFDVGTTGAVGGSLVQNSARAGIAAFSGFASVAGTTLECNAIALDGENPFMSDYAFVDGGDNMCGCHGAMAACKVSTAMLEPPGPSP